MSVEVVELITGPRLRGGLIEFVYRVRGTEDILEARDALLDDENTPPTFAGLTRTSRPDLDPVGVDSWDGTVRYGAPGGNLPATDEEFFNFNVGGGSARITAALATERFGADAPDTGAAIGVVPDGAGGVEVQGIDINVPTANFTIRRMMSSAIVTDAYQRLLEEMAYTTNAGTFRGRPAGEVLFMGATGALRPLIGDYDMSFNFARRRNRSNLVIPGVPDDITLTGTTGGWQHVETRFQQGRLVGAYRHTIYAASNFADLEIPVS